MAWGSGADATRAVRRTLCPRKKSTSQIAVILRAQTRGRDSWFGMNHQNRSHSKRSVAVGEGGGDTESKNPVNFRERFSATIGCRSDIPRDSSLRGSFLAAPFRMTVFERGSLAAERRRKGGHGVVEGSRIFSMTAHGFDGILRLRSGRKAPSTPLRMTAIWGIQRFCGQECPLHVSPPPALPGVHDNSFICESNRMRNVFVVQSATFQL